MSKTSNNRTRKASDTNELGEILKDLLIVELAKAGVPQYSQFCLKQQFTWIGVEKVEIKQGKIFAVGCSLPSALQVSWEKY